MIRQNKAKILTKIRQLKKKERKKERKKKKEGKTKLTFWDYYLSFYTREADKINPYSQIHNFLLHLISSVFFLDGRLQDNRLWDEHTTEF